MATVITGSPREQLRRGQPRREYRFYALLATAMAVLVVIAFSVQVSMGRSTFASPLRVHLHAVAFMGWISLFLAQSWFAARGDMTLHRRLGWLSLGWMALMLTAAAWVMIAMTRNAKIPFFFPPQQLLIGDPLALLGFVGLSCWAIARRRDTEWHARLHICAMASLMAPAFGRLIPMPLLIPYALEISSLLVLVFPITGMIRDLRQRGRVHPAWLAGAAILLTNIAMVDVIAYSPVGAAVYRTVTTGSPGAQIDPLAYPPPPATPLITGR